MPIKVSCAKCSKEILRKPSVVKRYKQLFCSHECRSKFYNFRTYKVCIQCGKNIERKDSKAKTCSRECSNKLRTGLKYKLGQPNNKSLKIATIKQILAEKRGNRCEVCSYDKVLIVHHITEKKNGGSDELKNLMLICPNCHGEIHAKLIDSKAFIEAESRRP